ncbi:hypothetical protein M426DRAFT_103609 [Hypoxylon sp. CI-4A]|nr:hypothetical protein M426DRAFT_103609 [Hypoxylon sp. CI-4A]
MPMLFGLNLSLPKRIGIVGMFSLGVLICILSFLRIIWLINWDLTDSTYGVGPGTIYGGLEPTLGIVNACLPVMKPALKRIFGSSLLGGTRSSSGSSKRSGTSRNQDGRLPPSIRDPNDVDIENAIVVTTEWQVINRGEPD